jgi:hypothetical protein
MVERSARPGVNLGEPTGIAFVDRGARGRRGGGWCETGLHAGLMGVESFIESRWPYIPASLTRFSRPAIFNTGQVHNRNTWT